jgi:hypothetical protein
MKQKLITDYFNKDNLKNKKVKINNSNGSDNYNNLEKIVYGFNSKTNSWHCTMCGLDMGENNPRQLCGKTLCKNY